MHNPKDLPSFPPKIKKGPPWLRAYYDNEFLKKNLLKKA